MTLDERQGMTLLLARVRASIDDPKMGPVETALIGHAITWITQRISAPDDAAILELAHQIGAHWRDQEGVNGELLDALAEATRTVRT